MSAAKTLWHVVVDQQLRHSVWPDDRSVPMGWTIAGFAGSREECLAEIEEIWTDPRPLGLREAMNQTNGLTT